MKKMMKGLAMVLVVLMFCMELSMIRAYAAPKYTGKQGWIDYSGIYRRKKNSKNLYIDFGETPRFMGKKKPYDGQVWVYYKETWKPLKIKRVRKNSYKAVKNGKTYLTFKVKKKKIILKQKRRVIKGINLSGTYIWKSGTEMYD